MTQTERPAVRVLALSAQDAQRYRALMLEAYDQAPDAFTSTVQERAVEPLDWWAQRITPASGLSQVLGAFVGQQLVGTVALEYASKPKTRHWAQVIGMYVQPGYRGLGLGALLMQAAVTAASEHPEVCAMRLTVTEGNEAAVRLYQSVGFRAWGVEPLAMRTATGYKGKVHMSMQLPQVQATSA